MPTTTTIAATYKKNGLLKLRRRLPLPDNTPVTVTWHRARNIVDATRAMIKVPRKVVIELTTPHRHDLWSA